MTDNSSNRPNRYYNALTEPTAQLDPLLLKAAARSPQVAEQVAKLFCDGPAKFTAVGPDQAPGTTGYARDEQHRKPKLGEVAIADPKRFGLTRQQLRDGADAQIKIYPHGLDQVLKETGGPTPPFTVGDIGDRNIRNYAGNWFDIYRFPTKAQADKFGKPIVPTTVEVPALPGAHCPPGMTQRK